MQKLKALVLKAVTTDEKVINMKRKLTAPAQFEGAFMKYKYRRCANQYFAGRL